MIALAVTQLLLATTYNQLWYSVPLIVAISLVYGATRDEEMGPILIQSYRAAVWIVTFLAIVFAVLLVVSWFV